MRININKNLVLANFVMSFLSQTAFNNLVPLNRKDSRTIAFIDSSIVHCENMVQDVIPEARAIIIGSEDDGIIEITRILNNSSCLEIHIFSSGFPGCIHLGNSELSINSLDIYRFSLQNWFKRSNLRDSENSWSRIHIYSRNLNVGDVGEEFVVKLNKITKAKINTSSNFFNSTVLNNRFDLN